MTLCSAKYMEHLVKSMDLADTIPLETESSTVKLLMAMVTILILVCLKKN